MAVTIDTSVLLGYYQSRTSLAGAGGGLTSASGTGKTKYAPTPPWDTSSGVPRATELVKSAMAGRRLINENGAQLDLPGASEDYRKLFSLYQGLNTLYGLAERAQTKGVSESEITRLAATFQRGLTEVAAYSDSLKLDQIRVTRGETMLNDKSAVGTPRARYEYKTATLYTGAYGTVPEQLQGDVAFDISVKRLNSTYNLNVDLNDMGSTPRTLGNVVAFINDKLAGQGLTTRFAVERTTAAPREVEVGGKKVTLPAVGDAFSLKIIGDSAEQLTFSAAAATPSVYVTTKAGDPDPDKKADTDDAVYANTLTKIDGAGGGTVGSKIYTKTLEGTVDAVRASQVGPDGSLYMLADVTGAVDGQTIKGEKDVALLKYDSAGKLLYARTLGAASESSGLSLAVSADGKVVVAGAITGALGGATAGALNSADTSGKSDSFVTLYDGVGDEIWSVRRGAREDDEAQAVAFGADGAVYVAGRTKSSMPAGGAMAGGWDGYLTSYTTDAKGLPKTGFTQQFGTVGDDKVRGLVVNGSQVIVGSVEGAHAILRSYDVSGGVATAGALRDLGDLQGGDIAGIALGGGKIVIGGSARDAALALGTPSRAAAGGMEAFAAEVSTDLSSTAGDGVAYWGGTGNDTATAMAVSGGKVWLTGVAGADMPGAAAIAKQDAYVVRLDIGTGAADQVQRISGKDGVAAPTSIAVDASGASALDALGLPRGTIAWKESQSIVSNTSARAGDTFQVRTREGGAFSTVTLEAKDTLETLAAKIKRAAGFRAKVEIVSDGDYRRLKISPVNDQATVEIVAGKAASKDLLESLGLTAGVVRNTEVVNGVSKPTDGGGTIYGLKLNGDLSLNDEAGTKAAMAALSTSLTQIRNAYRELEKAAKPATAATPQITGSAPAYLTSQIANYQAALDRLTVGG